MKPDRGHRCFDPEELGGIAGLALQDPRLLEAEECPRCRARLLVYREFVADRSTPTGTDLPDASARLRRAFEEELTAVRSSRPFPEGADNSSTPRAGAGIPRSMMSTLAGLAGRLVRRPVWAAVLLLVIAGGIYTGMELRPSPNSEDLLRGGARIESTPRVRLLPPRPLPGGAVEFSWSSVHEADAYQILLLGTDLSDQARIGPVTDTLFVVRADQIPRTLRSGAVAGWQIAAFRNGSEIARSALSTFRVP